MHPSGGLRAEHLDAAAAAAQGKPSLLNLDGGSKSPDVCMDCGSSPRSSGRTGSMSSFSTMRREGDPRHVPLGDLESDADMHSPWEDVMRTEDTTSSSALGLNTAAAGQGPPTEVMKLRRLRLKVLGLPMGDSDLHSREGVVGLKRHSWEHDDAPPRKRISGFSPPRAPRLR